MHILVRQGSSLDHFCLQGIDSLGANVIVGTKREHDAKYESLAIC